VKDINLEEYSFDNLSKMFSKAFNLPSEIDVDKKF